MLTHYRLFHEFIAACCVLWQYWLVKTLISLAIVPILGLRGIDIAGWENVLHIDCFRILFSVFIGIEYHWKYDGVIVHQSLNLLLWLVISKLLSLFLLSLRSHSYLFRLIRSLLWFVLSRWVPLRLEVFVLEWITHSLEVIRVGSCSFVLVQVHSSSTVDVFVQYTDVQVILQIC